MIKFLIDLTLQGWTRIAKAVNADTRVANRVIYDVLNEPDAFGVAFEPKNGKPGMRDLYLKSFDAIYAVNPGASCSRISAIPAHINVFYPAAYVTVFFTQHLSVYRSMCIYM